MRERIDSHDYEAVFGGGGCFHFALRLHERYKYDIRGTRSLHDGISWGHVWAKKGDDGIDIRGIYKEGLISMLANGGLSCAIETVQAEDARSVIGKNGFTEDLSAELFSLADRILDTHVRFQTAKPLSPEALTLLNDFGNGG